MLYHNGIMVERNSVQESHFSCAGLIPDDEVRQQTFISTLLSSVDPWLSGSIWFIVQLSPTGKAETDMCLPCTANVGMAPG